MNTKIVGALLVAILIAIGGYFFPAIRENLGVVGTRFPNGLAVGSTASVTQNKITVGNNGTALGTANFGTCYLFGDSSGVATTFTASSTLNIDCQATQPLKNGPASKAVLTGVTVGDAVFVSATSSFPALTGLLPTIYINDVSASSTAGYITLTFVNTSGRDLTLGTTSIDGWRYWVVK